MSKSAGIELIGGDAKVFQEYLEEDSCFGSLYAKSAPECQQCKAAVIYNGQLFLLSELCKARSLGSRDPRQLVKLTSRQVLDRLEAGRSVKEIFLEILGGNDPEKMGMEARGILAGRLAYLKVDLGLPVPELPRTKKLVEENNVSD